MLSTREKESIRNRVQEIKLETPDADLFRIQNGFIKKYNSEMNKQEIEEACKIIKEEYLKGFN